MAGVPLWLNFLLWSRLFILHLLCDWWWVLDLHLLQWLLYSLCCIRLLLLITQLTSWRSRTSCLVFWCLKMNGGWWKLKVAIICQRLAIGPMVDLHVWWGCHDLPSLLVFFNSSLTELLFVGHLLANLQSLSLFITHFPNSSRFLVGSFILCLQSLLWIENCNCLGSKLPAFSFCRPPVPLDFQKPLHPLQPLAKPFSWRCRVLLRFWWWLCQRTLSSILQQLELLLILL